MELKPQTSQHIFLGGPLHGLLRPVEHPGKPVICRGRDDRRAEIPPRALRPCLELEEIKALTGRTWHRVPGVGVLEDYEREELTRKVYQPQMIEYRRGRVEMMYVLTGYQLETFEVLLLIREHRPELLCDLT